MHNRVPRKVGTWLAASAVLFACGTNASKDGHAGPPPESPYPSCAAIIEACHPVDMGIIPDVSECHVLAHEATSDATCAPKKDSCVALCEAAGRAGDAGSAADAYADGP